MEKDKNLAIKFLGENVTTTPEERENPLFLLYLGFLEYIELTTGDAILFYQKFKSNYGLVFDTETESKITNILLKKKEK